MKQCLTLKVFQKRALVSNKIIKLYVLHKYGQYEKLSKNKTKKTFIKFYLKINI